MKHIDALSVGIAALIGALALLVAVGLFDKNNQQSGLYAMLGALTGAIVQVGLRTSGVS